MGKAGGVGDKPMKGQDDVPSVSGRTGYRWVVLALIFIMYTVAFADRANVGIALPHIKQEFALNNAQVGLIASLFSIAYAVCQFPAGLLVRRFGVRRVAPLFMTLTSLTAATAGMAGSVLALQVSRLVLGVVEAPIGLAMMTTINNWFPRREKGTAAGIFSAATKFGPVIVPPIGALIIASYGWRPVFFAFAAPGIVVAVLWYFLVAERPRLSRYASTAEADYIEQPDFADPFTKGAGGGGGAGLDRLIRAKVFDPIDTVRGLVMSWTMWGTALCYLLVQSVVGVILFLLPLYLTEVKKLSIMSVGFVAAAPFAGAVVGNIVGGVISDRVFGGRRKPMMLVTFAATVCTMWLLTSAPNAVLPLSGLLFLTGVLLAVGYSPYSVYAAPMTTAGAFPVALSIINTMGQIGTALAPLVTGIVLDIYGWNTVFTGLSAASLLGFFILVTVAEPIRAGERQLAGEHSPNENALAAELKL